MNKLKLRKVEKKDIILRQKYGYSTVLAKMTGGGFDKINNYALADATKWYEGILKHPCKWVISYDDVFIGTASLRPMGDNKAKYAIELYDQYNKGIGTQITTLVLDYAFNQEQYNKVFLRVLDYNERGIKVYKNCGFKVEGVDREGAFINGTYHSDVYMGILRREFIKSK
jgi:RimJ/RimL family protein N-acetyltransferase